MQNKGKICNAPGKECDRPAKIRGMCKNHYTVWIDRRDGYPRQNKYNRKHKKELYARGLKWKREHKERINEIARLSRIRRRALSYELIAARWNHEVGCMWDLTPTLKPIPCLGKLELDHMEGGGNIEYRKNGRNGSKIFALIVNGTRTPRDLRLLCQLHNKAWWLLRTGAKFT